MNKKYKKEIDNIVKTLKNKYEPEKIVLFGSAINGKTHRWSDIDMIVVKKTRKGFYQRLKEVALLCKDDARRDIDFLVYTPDEYEEKINEENPFFFGVKKSHKILYEKSGL